MKGIDHGVFTQYTPDQDKLPSKHPFKGHSNVGWLKNEQGVDWYDLALNEPWRWLNKKEPRIANWVVVDPATGKVRSQSPDPSTLFPVDSRLVETAETVSKHMLWNGTEFITAPPYPEDVLPSTAALTFTDEHEGIFRAHFDGKCVAQVQMWIEQDVPYITRTYVREELEGTGVLTALYHHVEAYVKGPVLSQPEYISLNLWAEYKVLDIIPDDVVSQVTFKEHPNEIFLAMHGENIAAVVQVWRHPDTQELCVYRFFTHKAYQRKRIMTAMYKYIEAERKAKLIPMPLFTRTAVGINFREKFEANREPLPTDPSA